MLRMLKVEIKRAFINRLFLVSLIIGCIISILQVVDAVAEEHTGVAHPFGEGAELDGDPVVRGEAGRVGSPEKDEPDKRIPRELFRPIQGMPELAQENLQEQNQHEKRKQNLADFHLLLMKIKRLLL